MEKISSRQSQENLVNCNFKYGGGLKIFSPRSNPREEQLIRARLFADRGLLEYIPWETVEAAPMLALIEKLLHEPAPYEAALVGFPMTAFDVINQRIQSFGAQA